MDQGFTFTGVFKGQTANGIALPDKDGKLISIPKKDVDTRKFSPVSTMGMTLQDFADVIAFLEAREEVKPASTK